MDRSDDSDSQFDDEHIDEDALKHFRQPNHFATKVPGLFYAGVFRAMEVNENGLRSSSSSAHLAIYELAVCVLDAYEGEDENENGLL